MHWGVAVNPTNAPIHCGCTWLLSGYSAQGRIINKGRPLISSLISCSFREQRVTQLNGLLPVECALNCWELTLIWTGQQIQQTVSRLSRVHTADPTNMVLSVSQRSVMCTSPWTRSSAWGSMLGWQRRSCCRRWRNGWMFHRGTCY